MASRITDREALELAAELDKAGKHQQAGEIRAAMREQQAAAAASTPQPADTPTAPPARRPQRQPARQRSRGGDPNRAARAIVNASGALRAAKSGARLALQVVGWVIGIAFLAFLLDTRRDGYRFSGAQTVSGLIGVVTSGVGRLIDPVDPVTGKALAGSRYAQPPVPPAPPPTRPPGRSRPAAPATHTRTF